MVLRAFVLLLAAYIIFHKLFPIAGLARHLSELTVGEFLLTTIEALAATAAALYLVIIGFRQPDLQYRDRVWCERWSGLAFGVIALALGSILVVLLERKGIVIAAAHWVARGILWLLF